MEGRQRNLSKSRRCLEEIRLLAADYYAMTELRCPVFLLLQQNLCSSPAPCFQARLPFSMTTLTFSLKPSCFLYLLFGSFSCGYVWWSGRSLSGYA